ncbi:MAG: cobalt-precorrin-5B (C(1))-methyltransferase [Alphaproteobacteria bacterium]|nr:cobalt-precorrin-5B (C(1))-methyltransferase [Alphaproteobacteria bacterium]
MATTLTTQLRFGWTTGTCATAATYGAYMALVSGEFPQNVTIDTPSGKSADLALCHPRHGGDWAEVGVIKDAGDDPDVTHGAEIRARVEPAPQGRGVVFKGGEGVGIVTKPGLPIDAGEPAINPVPRQMMTECIANLAAETGGPSDVVITVSVPGGGELAAKTWNPRLGIEGGISILGTTGVVRPFSCSAWIASIHRGIDVARANGLDHVAGSTGATSEKAFQSRHHLPEIALLDMGDFVGGMLKYLRRHPVPRLTIAGGFAKMVKLAQGHGDLHSARSQIDFTAFAEMAAQAGLDHDAVKTANTALEVLQMADDDQAQTLGGMVARQALAEARGILRQDEVTMDVMIVQRDGTVLAEAD